MEGMNRRHFISMNMASLLGLPLGFSLLNGCSKPGGESAETEGAAQEVKTGGIRMVTVEDKYKVWTKRIGKGPIKMLALHGGPGATHEYFECFESFLPQHGIEFYYYDQLDSYYSDQPGDTSLWTVERYRDEVEQVRKALGLDNYFLYGNSWGGMLTIEYALKYQKHVKGIVISNMTASIDSYVKYINELRNKLPAETIRRMEAFEARGEYDAPEYQEIMFQDIYTQHMCRVLPWPEPVDRTFRHMNAKIYGYMQGPNEFIVNGTFKDWDRWDDLHKITVPTLLMVGRHDTMSVEDIEEMGRRIPNARVVICENGSHLSMWDDQKTYFPALIQFLEDVEKGRFT